MWAEFGEEMKMHPNEPKTLDELYEYLAKALKSGDGRKVYAIEKQIGRRKLESI